MVCGQFYCATTTRRRSLCYCIIWHGLMTDSGSLRWTTEAAAAAASRLSDNKHNSPVAIVCWWCLTGRDFVVVATHWCVGVIQSLIRNAIVEREGEGGGMMINTVTARERISNQLVIARCSDLYALMSFLHLDRFCLSATRRAAFCVTRRSSWRAKMRPRNNR